MIRTVFLLTSVVHLLLYPLENRAQQLDFQDVSATYGLTFQTGGQNIFGTGISLADIDQDGSDDITLTGSTGNPVRIYLSTGNSLTLLNTNINLDTYFTTSVLWADFDNDADMDLFSTQSGGPLRAFENLGSFNFIELNTANGISTDTLTSYAGAWGDYDLDGDLDFYATNRPSGNQTQNRNVLYRNDGNSTFTDVTEVAQVQDSQGIGYGVVFLDYDKDGYPDIYVANDKFINRNTLFRNLGNGTFADVSIASGTGFFIDGMGIAPGDLNRDGYEDMYVTNTAQSSWDFGGNLLLMNQTDGTFDEVAGDLEMRVYRVGWGCSAADFDNDGHLDLFVANEGETGADTNILFINNGDGTFFKDTTTAIYHTVGNSFGSAVGDVNNDGAMDIAVINSNPAEVKLWLNTGTGNSWVKFDLQGTVSNREAIGTWVEVYTNGQVQYRYKRSGTSYCSQDGSDVHFGLGSASIIDSVAIIWPTQVREVYYNLAVDQTHHIIETSVITAVGTAPNRQPNVYPNPATEALQLSWNSLNGGPVRIELCDSQGKVVHTWNVSTTTGKNTLALMLPALPTGIYTINCHSSKQLLWTESLMVR